MKLFRKVNIAEKYHDPIFSTSNVDPDFLKLKPKSQYELKDLVRDLNIWKMQAELLDSHLQG